MKYHSIPTLFDNQASLVNGKQIGTDSVRYIQDAGQKVAGTTYIDKNTNELYVCVTTTNSVNNDGNFSKFNLKEAFNKLDKLDRKNRRFALWNGKFNRGQIKIPNISQWYMVTVETQNIYGDRVSVYDTIVVVNPSGGQAEFNIGDNAGDITIAIDFSSEILKFITATGEALDNNFVTRIVGTILL